MDFCESPLHYMSFPDEQILIYKLKWLIEIPHSKMERGIFCAYFAKPIDKNASAVYNINIQF